MTSGMKMRHEYELSRKMSEKKINIEYEKFFRL